MYYRSCIAARQKKVGVRARCTFGAALLECEGVRTPTDHRHCRLMTTTCPLELIQLYRLLACALLQACPLTASVHTIGHPPSNQSINVDFYSDLSIRDYSLPPLRPLERLANAQELASPADVAVPRRHRVLLGMLKKLKIAYL